MDNDFGRLIIDKVVAARGERCTGYIQVCRSRLAEGLGITVFTLNKIWQCFCDEYTVSAYPRGGSFEGKLMNKDLELIEVLKHEKPSISLAEISDIVEQIVKQEFTGMLQ